MLGSNPNGGMNSYANEQLNYKISKRECSKKNRRKTESVYTELVHGCNAIAAKKETLDAGLAYLLSVSLSLYSHHAWNGNCVVSALLFGWGPTFQRFACFP